MSEIDHEVLRGYIRYLERGATTHAGYAQTASRQAVELSLQVEDLAAGRVAAAEDGAKVDGSPSELLAGRGQPTPGFSFRVTHRG